MTRVRADGFAFDFFGALDAFVFDEQDRNKPTFHGAPMKAVDVVAEFANYHVYVEIKDPPALETYIPELMESGRVASEADYFKWLQNQLICKYRDSLLYRHAERKAEKPVIYICLLIMSNAQCNRLRKNLYHGLPVKRVPRWKRGIVESCHVVNLTRWNRTFPRWPVRRLP